MTKRIKKSINDILNESLPNESLFSTANKDYKITEKEIQNEIQSYRKEKRIKLEEYLDMLIYQSDSNELKAGSFADNVVGKLRYIKSQILQDYEIVNRLNERLVECETLCALHDSDFNHFYDLKHELLKIRDGK